MNRIIVAIIFFVTAVSCNKPASMLKDKNESSRDSGQTGSTDSAGSDSTGSSDPNGGTAKQPTNVAGGMYLHNLECNVTNRGDSSAKQTIVGCIVKNEKGNKFAGKITDIIVSLYVKGQDKPIIGVAKVLGTDQPYSFAVVIDNSKPTDALSLKASALVDGALEQWLSSLLGDNVHATTTDMDLYVKSGAQDSGISCPKNAPCPTITNAMAFVPTEINHVVRIHVANGIYNEAILLTGKNFANVNGVIVFTGESINFVENGTDRFVLEPLPRDIVGFAASLSNDYLNQLTDHVRIEFRNAQINNPIKTAIEGGYASYGIFCDKATMKLSNVEVTGKWDIGLGAGDGGIVSLYGNTKISDFALSGIFIFGEAQVYLVGTTLLNSTQGTIGIDVEDHGFLIFQNKGQVVLDGEQSGKTTIDFLPSNMLPWSPSIGLQVTRANVGELNDSTFTTNGSLTIKNADVSIMVEQFGSMNIKYLDITANGCKKHCIQASNGGMALIQGQKPSELQATNGPLLPELELRLNSNSNTTGTVLSADGNGQIEISGLMKVTACNSFGSTATNGRYMVSSTLKGSILANVDHSETQGPCIDESGATIPPEVNRFVFVDLVSHVFLKDGDNLQPKDSVFNLISP